METKFTPGPWVFYGGSGSVISSEAPGLTYTESVVLEVHEGTVYSEYSADCASAECSIANRALIAAAPELYEALEDARKAVVLLADLTSCRGDDDYVDQLSATIEAALKKARGE